MSGAPSADAVDLYRTNPFRVLGVPVDADSRTVKRRREEFRLAHELGTPVRVVDGRLPPESPPDEHAVDLAYAAWQDLEQRLTAELFWFWGPPDGRGSAPSRVRAHDRAVWAHCRALDLEARAARHGLSEEERQRCHDHWREAAAAWGAVVGNRAVRVWLRQRVAAIDDPRLTARQATELQRGLPARWLEINARLAMDAADSGDAEVARHRVLMLAFVRAANLDRKLVDKAMYASALPTIREVEQACDDTRSAIDVRPEQACVIGTALAERMDQPLTRVNRLMTFSDPAAQRLRNEVAATLRQCAARNANAVAVAEFDSPGPDVARARSSLEASVLLLTTARGLASSPVSGEVAEDLTTLRTMLGSIAHLRARPPALSGPRAGADGANWWLGCFAFIGVVAIPICLGFWMDSGLGVVLGLVIAIVLWRGAKVLVDRHNQKRLREDSG